VRHHAGAHLLHFSRMTSRSPARLLRNTKIAGVHKLDEVQVFFQPVGISPNRVGGSSRVLRKTRLRVSLPGQFDVFRRALRNARRQRDLDVSTMAVGAPQAHGPGSVHGPAVHRVVAGHASSRFLLGLLDRVANPRGRLLIRLLLRRLPPRRRTRSLYGRRFTSRSTPHAQPSADARR